MDDRQGLALQGLDVQQPGLDVLDVVADRKVEQGDDRHRQHGQSRVDQQRDPEHPDQRQGALGQRRDGHYQPRGRAGLVVDQVDQHPGPPLIVVRHREPLGMLEQVAAEVESHVQVELCVHVVLEHLEDIDHERDEQAAEDDKGQQGRAVTRPGGHEAGEDRRYRLAAQHAVHQDLQRPGHEQAGRDAGDHDDHRADGQLPVRSQIVEDSPEVRHDPSRLWSTRVRRGDGLTNRAGRAPFIVDPPSPGDRAALGPRSAARA